MGRKRKVWMSPMTTSTLITTSILITTSTLMTMITLMTTSTLTTMSILMVTTIMRGWGRSAIFCPIWISRRVSG